MKRDNIYQNIYIDRLQTTIPRVFFTNVLLLNTLFPDSKKTLGCRVFFWEWLNSPKKGSEIFDPRFDKMSFVAWASAQPH